MKKISFAISLIFFWIKGEVGVDNRFVKTNVSNTILGFIPAGKDQQNIPLKNISGAMLSSSFLMKPIILGLIVAFFGLSLIGDDFFAGLIVTVIGICVLLSGIQTVLVIEKGGSPYYISVPFYEKAKMVEINNAINEALAVDTDKTDLNLYFDKKTAE